MQVTNTSNRRGVNFTNYVATNFKPPTLWLLRTVLIRRNGRFAAAGE